MAKKTKPKKKAVKTVTAPKKASRAMTLQDRLKQLKDSGVFEGGGDAFWRPKPGTHYLRILPAVGTMEFFFETVGRHFLGGTALICPNLTQETGDPCPICEAGNALRRGSRADRDLASKLKIRRQFWMNVMVRKKGPGGEFDGPFIFTPGVSIFEALQGLLMDPDYADEILSPTKGIDIRLVREGTGRTDTNYDVFPTRKMVLMHPDIEDEDKAWDWLEENAEDISGNLELPSFDELEEELAEVMADTAEPEKTYVGRSSGKRKKRRR